MRFVIAQQDLASGLQVVARAISSKNTLPILTGILINAAEDHLTLTATDLEIGIECRVPARVLVPGSTVLPARHLTDLVRKIPFGEITMDLDQKNYTITMRWGRSQYIIHGQSPDQFPYLPSTGTATPYALSHGLLRGILRQTAFAVSHDETRPVLTGALFKIRGEVLEVIATDGVKIAFRRGQIESTGFDTAVVVPGRTLNELSRLLSGDDKDAVKVFITQNQAFFDLGNIKVVSRLLEGQYPDVMRLVPQNYASTAYVHNVDLLEACDRASLLAKDGAIKLAVTADTIIVTANTPEVGQVYEEVSSSLEGEPLEIGYNVRYLLEGLRACDDEEIAFNFAGSRSPARIKPRNHENFLYIVLPLITY